jgi:hypothetical protein
MPFSDITDQGAEVAAHVVDYRLVEAVPTDPHGLRVDDAVQRYHRDLGSAAADVEDHGTPRLAHRQTGSYRRRHRLLHEVDPSCPGAGRRLPNRPPLDLGRAAGNAHEHPWTRPKETVLVRAVNEVLQHLLGDGEVRDHAILQRTNGLDVSWRATEHALGGVTDRRDALGAAVGLGADRHHRGLVQHDALVTRVDEGVGGSEIDREIGREETTETF